MSRHTPEGAGAVSWAILAVGLTMLALAYLILGCQTPGAPATPEKSWKAALSTYEALAVGMEVYCGTPQADPTPCIQAAVASVKAENIIRATRESLASGHATAAILEGSVAALKSAEPALRAVQPKGQE